VRGPAARPRSTCAPDDLVNLGLARAAGPPVAVVGDIDRGGVFAGLFGTLGLLEAADQALVAGFLVNKFRGGPAILAPGLDQLTRLTGRPVLGVLPWRRGLRLDAEDSVGLETPADGPALPRGPDPLQVAVVRLPWLSNFTDFDPLVAEPGVSLRFTAASARGARGRPGRGPRDQGHRRRPGLAPADGAGSGAGRAGRPRPAQPGYLWRLPAPRGAHHRPGRQIPRRPSCVSCCSCFLPSRSWCSERRPHPHRPRRARSTPGRPGDRQGRDRADTETFPIEILPPEAPTITTEALSSGTVGGFYCCGNLFAGGGVQPYTWSVVAGALPPGLELPRRENTISGTPTTAGTFTFTVRVTDDLGAFSEKALSITIS
jgi:Putative Ig domain